MHDGGPPAQVPGFYPISIGRGVSLSFNLLRFGWRTFVAINLVAIVPVAIVTSIAALLTYDAMSEWQQSLLATPFGPRADATAALAGFPWSALGVTIVASFLVGPFATIGGAALINATQTAIGGGRLSARHSLAAALARLKSLLGIYFLLWITSIAVSLVGVTLPLLSVLPSALGITGGPIALLGLIVFVSVMFAFGFMAIRLALVVEALMVEHLSVVDAVRRSWRLLGGSMLRLVGWALVFALILGLIDLVIGIVAFIIGIIISPTALTSLGSVSATAVMVQSLVTTIAGAVFQPLATIGMTLLYFDIRRRRGDSVPEPGQPPS